MWKEGRKKGWRKENDGCLVTLRREEDKREREGKEREGKDKDGREGEREGII